MNHFGIAFGVITAVAIGGAVVFDRTVSHHPQATRVATAAKPQTIVADASAPAVPAIAPFDSGKESANASVAVVSPAAAPSKSREPKAPRERSVAHVAQSAPVRTTPAMQAPSMTMTEAPTASAATETASAPPASSDAPSNAPATPATPPRTEGQEPSQGATSQ